jgi:hypothetical protein
MAASLLVATSAAAGDTSPAVDFNREIRPILSASCYQCHGPDHNKRKADLRLDTREGLFRVIDGSAIVTPGEPESSELLRRITTDDDQERMPPAKSGPRLTAAQVNLVERWIRQGAAWKGHWSYVSQSRPKPPYSAPRNAALNPIDDFIDSRLSIEGLAPAPEANRATLIRRLTFDLTGLPPTLNEVDSFKGDECADAYERVVDRLLASPHYGERMAIFWLDLVRFADTTGYHGDNHVDLFLYRDYVIRSFNANRPFDRFTIEQLAGDLLPAPTDETRIASGYNRLLQTTQEGGAQAKEYTAKYAADRVRNVSTVWLGSTMGCAECHDHKYDPFTSRDFYSLAAFFADVKETAVGVQEPTRFPSRAQADLLRKLTERRDGQSPPKAGAAAERKALDRQIEALLREIPNSLVSESVPPRTIRILPRGNWLDETGPVMVPQVPLALGALGAKGTRATRLDLARWLVDRNNPLASRVMVNRLWKLAFGQGLVATPDDLGSQGSLPTHPELLDWLASEFVDSGWNVKALFRLMVTSRAYCRSSTPSDQVRRKDPANRWLARQNRFRLDAEMVRDNALAISGLLFPKIGGRSVKPYQPPGYWIFLNFPKRDYAADHGENQYRRGLYTYWQRTFLHPSLLAFDASTREECVVDRPRSNTPVQALVLLNDPTYIECARALAGRLIREGGIDPTARLDRVFRLALGRPPRTDELNVLLGVLQKHTRQFRADPAAARAMLGVGDAPVAADIEAAELAAWTSVARVILNLQETVTRS